MKHLSSLLLITSLICISEVSMAQSPSEQRLKQLTKEFTKDIKDFTLEQAPEGKKSEWYKLAKELGKKPNQEKLLKDLKKELPSMQDVPGGQDEAVRKYFEQYKNTLGSGAFDERPGFDAAAALPYPFCVINDSCED